MDNVCVQIKKFERLEMLERPERLFKILKQYNFYRRCSPQVRATARASAASSGVGMCLRLSWSLIIFCICLLSAFP